MNDRRATAGRRLAAVALVVATSGMTGCGGGGPEVVETADHGRVASEFATSTAVSVSTSRPAASIATTTAPRSGPTVATTRVTAPSSTTTAAPPSTTGAGPTTTAPRPTTTTTQRVRARLPGAPGSITVDFGLTEDLKQWYTLVEQGVGQAAPWPACKDLITKVQGSLDNSAARGAYARLYLGVAEGCIGNKASARKNLDIARSLVPNLKSDPGELIGKDTTCQPEKLLVWAYDTYFDESITVPCTPP